MEPKLEKYLEILLEKNQGMNLTAIREPEEARVRHFEDSLKLLELFDLRGKRVLDVGSGGGFPGLALKIAEPSILMTLLDSTGKKVDFLRECSEKLRLDGVDFVCARAEEYAHTGARGTYDFVVARGVAGLPVLCELCLPLVKTGGYMLAMKGSPDEAADYRALGGERLPDTSYRLSDGTIHYVITIRKITDTNSAYPRLWKQIKNKPLA